MSRHLGAVHPRFAAHEFDPWQDAEDRLARRALARGVELSAEELEQALRAMESADADPLACQRARACIFVRAGRPCRSTLGLACEPCCDIPF